MDREQIKRDFRAAISQQVREFGHVGLITDEAPDTGKQYAIWNGYLIPLSEAHAIIQECAEEAEHDHH